MSGKVLFAQVLHCHQPVGNFDEVFEMACAKAYGPYIEEYLRSGRMPVSLHYSGSLLDWLVGKKHPMLRLLREAASGCDVEFVGGGWFEPILTMLLRRDAVGQLRGGMELVRQVSGRRPRGAWITERVWEQYLVSVLAEAGVEYAVLDDSHFAHAGLDVDRLGPYYLAEDQGRLVGIFPASERMRYLIPFGTVEQVVEELRRHRPEGGQALVVYADDGEKFGLWPGTHKHVYTDGWLARFHAALAAEREWLEPVTLSTAFDRLAPAGNVYLADDSYREMTEWALPAPAQAEFLRLSKELSGDGRYQRIRRFVRGGTWRAFKARYAELARAYARMTAVSDAVNALPARSPARARALRELYQSQCNCAWWHGVFGGTYLAHLRGAVWKHLLAAERIARAASRKRPAPVRSGDFDLDGIEELRLSGARLSAFVAPERGGHAFEIDLPDLDQNVTDVLTRRYEAYPEDVKEALARAAGRSDGQVSIHDLQRTAGREHADHLVYDRETRESLVDHLCVGDWRVEDLWRTPLPGDDDFRTGAFDVLPGGRPPAGDEAAVAMVRAGPVGGHGRLELVKTLAIPAGRAALSARYRLANRGAEPLEFVLAVELNLCPDFQVPAGGEPRGPEVAFFADCRRLPLRCPARGLSATLAAPGAAGAVWQVKTVSQSESSYELGIQGLCATVWWPVRLEPGAEVGKELELGFARG
jgi:hypothetical protein